MDDQPSPRASADKLNARGAAGGLPRAGRGRGGKAKTGPHPAEAARQADPSTACGGPPPPAELGADIRDYQAGRNRRVQVTKRGWNRFDAAKKKIFLKWFAATANAKGSARRAGVGYSTVFDHRMADARFAEAWDRALEQSYARLEAKMVEMQFEEAAGGEIEFDGSFEPPDATVVDMAMAMQLLKQHKAEVMRIRAERALREGGARRRKLLPHERARTASDAEMRRALVKSLRAFGARVKADDLRAQPGRGTGEGTKN